jgi:MGT family glycosyltransferase
MMSLERKFDLLIYEMFFYPGFRIAELLGIPCVRQFSQPAWNGNTLRHATWFFKLSCILIDTQVMGKKNAIYMELKNKTLAEAVINDNPALNIVYVPQIFQTDRDSFGKDYLFTTPASESVSVSQKIPYETMKPPIVYISLGSIISNRGFCKECIRAFGGKDMSVILNTGRIRPETLGKIPGNIYAYSYVPQVDVLYHSDVFLTHCGMNSVNEAMNCGVPMVAMPFVNDQISNAKKVIELGIGKRVCSFPSSGRQLYETVKAVYADKDMKTRSQVIRDMVVKETAMSEVIGRVEELLEHNNTHNH